MTMGAVKIYNETKGCGVIALQQGGKKAFVQGAALERAGIGGLSEGHTVSFDSETDERNGKTAASNNQLS
jgi:cold shock CspA family protein